MYMYMYIYMYMYMYIRWFNNTFISAQQERYYIHNKGLNTEKF